MELILDRKLADRRLFPAIDIQRSGTRREDLLLNKEELEYVWSLRRATASMSSIEALENLLDRLKNTRVNEEMLFDFKPRPRPKPEIAAEPEIPAKRQYRRRAEQQG